MKSSKTYICTFCRHPCTPQVIDVGYGAYEYWGATGVHTQLDVVSDCCQEPVEDEYGNAVEVNDLPKEEI